MEILIIWIITVIASFCLEISNDFRMFKDVADAGYKIDSKRLSELGKQLNPNGSKIKSLLMLIPMLNIMLVFQRAIQYNNIRPMVLDQLRVMDSLEEMSEIEKAEYQKNPTGLNALIVPLKSEIKLSKATLIKINNGNEHSVIYYEMGKTIEDITILKVIGSATRLTVEEQKKMVIEAWKNLVQAGLKKYGDEETLINALKSNTSMYLSDSEEDKKYEETTTPIRQEASVSEQKEQLEKLRDELLEEKSESKENDGPKLINKKK